MKATCSKCHRVFLMGFRGIFNRDDKPVCDHCARVRRGATGAAHEPQEHTPRKHNRKGR